MMSRRKTSGAGHSPNARTWSGQARIGLGWAIFTGHAGDNAPHRHHAVQIALAQQGRIRVWTAGKDWFSTPGIIIGADVPHRLAESDTPVTLLYLEGESEQGQAVQSLLQAGVGLLTQRRTRLTLEALATVRGQDPAIAVVRALMAGQDAASRRSASDPLITASLAALPRPLPPHLTTAALAQRSRLSPSRYAHRFAAQTGMALRPYLRWLRLLTAVEAIVQGTNLTDAAHSAGFADSAHFSRTFRRHFGIVPRVLLDLALSGPARPDTAAD